MSRGLTSTGEPLALPKVRSGACNDLDVVEICVAHSGAVVPSKHGVDRLGKLGTGCLVYTAGVDPAELQTFGLRLLTCPSDLGKTDLLLRSLRKSIAHVLVRDFLGTPCVGQDGVFRNGLFVHKLLKAEGFRVQEAHGRNM